MRSCEPASGSLEGLHSLSDVKQYARFWIGMFSKVGFVPAQEVDDSSTLYSHKIYPDKANLTGQEEEVDEEGRRVVYKKETELRQSYELQRPFIDPWRSIQKEPEKILNRPLMTYGDFEWSADSKAIYWISRNDNNRPEKVFRRVIGSGVDELVYHEEDPGYF